MASSLRSLAMTAMDYGLSFCDIDSVHDAPPALVAAAATP
jgi:hypothetical protein